MAIHKKIQLYVSDATGNQKTAKYYRIPLPADNLPFDKVTNTYKNMMHFYCTISGDSATFGAIGFADSILGLYEDAAGFAYGFDANSELPDRYKNITPTIPEKLLNDGELSFDVIGSMDTINYNSAEGYVYTGTSLFSHSKEDQVKYLEKIVKKSGIFKSTNVIRSNTENELSQFVPSNWQEFDTIDDLLADVRSRINVVKTMDRGELFTYEECTVTDGGKFNAGIDIPMYALGTLNELKVVNLGGLSTTDHTVETGCDGHQRILVLSNHLNNDYDLVVDTTTLTDEIAVVGKTYFNSTIATVAKIQPNSGDVKLKDKFGEYGTAIVFKNKADSANLKLKVVDDIKPIDMLTSMAGHEDVDTSDFVNVLKHVSVNDFVETGAAMPPHVYRTNVPLTDFVSIKGNENFKLLDVTSDNVTFKFTPGTKFKLFVKSPNYKGSEIPVDNSTGTFEANLIAHSDGIAGDAKLLLVTYGTTDITVSW